MGLPMVLLYRVLKGKYNRFIVPALIPLAVMSVLFFTGFTNPSAAMDGLPGLAFAVIGCSLTVPLLLRYNGRQYGKNKPYKYLFYVYYPAHLLVLSLVRAILFGDWVLF